MRVGELFVDEVQDMTQGMLQLALLAGDDPNAMFLAGKAVAAKVAQFNVLLTII
jgi:hypothetical protein